LKTIIAGDQGKLEKFELSALNATLSTDDVERRTVFNLFLNLSLNLPYRFHLLLETVSEGEEEPDGGYGNKLTDVRKECIGEGRFLSDTEHCDCEA